MYGGGCVSVERWGVVNMRLKETSTADQAYSGEDDGFIRYKTVEQDKNVRR